MSNNLLIAVLMFTLLFGCKSHETQIGQVDKTIPKLTDKNSSVRDYSISALLWQQNAAEYRALAYQAFNVAKIQLDDILENKTEYKKPLAIVTDIDETVLNNSPYNGKLIELNVEYDKTSWLEWGSKKKAKAVPGSLNFFKYAQSKGVKVFYVSNRYDVQKSETLENLQQLGFPFSDEAHILLRTDDSGKESRRLKIKESYEIIMLLGDNLSDFSDVFDNQSTNVRNNKVDSLMVYFGSKFIVLPNAIYGDWETKGILENNYDWTNFQKDSIMRAKIISY